MPLTKVIETINTFIKIMTYEELFTFENLNNAFYEVSRISQWKEKTQLYKMNLLINNLELQDELLSHTYRVSKTTNFQINERGKIRHIEAPAIRDRIVQKVLCKFVYFPQLVPLLIYDNYASIKKRGTTFARKRLDILLRRYLRNHENGYILKIDIKKFFDNVDHEVLKQMLHKKLHTSQEVFDLTDYLIDSSSHTNKGLNLGSEAPQIFANFYLSPIDNYVKNVKGIKFYGRYMDDIYIISENKDELKSLLSEIKLQLANLKLKINDKKTHITTLKHGFTYLQIKYRIDGKKIIKRPTRNKVVRERRRLKKFKSLLGQGLMTEKQIYNCYYSWRNGLAIDCNYSKKTITSMDNLYKSLFGVYISQPKLTRDAIISNFKGGSYKCIM